jgi:ketosteroid isomerase-like protein
MHAMGTREALNRQLVERYWEAHFRRAWDEMATFFTEDCHYTDVGMDPTGATGPAEIIARLRLGIEPLAGYYHYPRHMIAEGSLVITEHVERWEFVSGEIIDHPFASVMEASDGMITRWHDYSNLPNILDNAPTEWIEHIANGWK